MVSGEACQRLDFQMRNVWWKRTVEKREQYGRSANTPVPFPTCPNCQIGGADAIWSIIIGSQSKFGICLTDLAIGAPHVWNKRRAEPSH